MKVLILAGGLGTRLKRITKKTPKPMIMIGNKPVLQHIVDRLHNHGLKQVIVKVHYKPEQILTGMNDKTLFYYEAVLFSHQETLVNMRDWLGEDDFMVINGDTISEVNFTEMIAFHKPGTITMFADEYRCAGVWIYPKEWFDNKDVSVRYYRPKISWFDIGTPDRLEAARDHFLNGRRII